jgi:hypothetical protein
VVAKLGVNETAIVDVTKAAVLHIARKQPGFR